MRKTSVYLSEADRARLQRLAERKGKSQAWVLREALLAYEASEPDRDFAIFDAWKDLDLAPLPEFKDPQEFQDYIENVLMKGFGDESLGDWPLDSDS